MPISVGWTAIVRLTLACLAAGVFASGADAQSFPSQPIHITVAAGAGSPPDIVTRVVANAMAKAEGWTVIVENKPGALQTIGGRDVLNHPADGYTICAFSMPVTAAPALMVNMPFALDKDFAAVGLVSRSYNVLVVTPSLPVHSIADLIALLKQKPNKLAFSSGGFGTPAHLVGEMFKLREHVSALHVPYARVPQATGDLLNGTNQFMFITTLPVVGLIKAGKLRALAVTAPKRIDALPDVATVAEQGYPELAVEDWVGFVVKTGTPQEATAKLNAALNKALASPAVKEAFARIGAETAGGTREQFAALIGSQMTHWGKVVKESGITMQK